MCNDKKCVMTKFKLIVCLIVCFQRDDKKKVDVVMFDRFTDLKYFNQKKQL
jgi:hypothetical protein